MKSFAVILAVAGAVMAGSPPASEYTDGQPQVPTGSWSSPATYATSSSTSSAAAVVTSSSSSMAVPYPVPGGNSTMAATGTAPVKTTAGATTLTSAYNTASQSTAASSPTAPATGGAAALQVGLGAALAGVIALLA